MGVNGSVTTTTNATVRVVVTNTGAEHTSAEVAQLYLGFLEEVGEPPRQLKGFLKMAPLAPSASTTVKFILTAKDQSSIHAGCCEPRMAARGWCAAVSCGESSVLSFSGVNGISSEHSRAAIGTRGFPPPPIEFKALLSTT